MKIGQYIPGNSIIHSLDPRTKLIIIVFFALFILLADNFATIGITGFVLILIIVLTQLRISYILLPIRFLSLILIFTFLVYLVDSEGYSLNQRLYLGVLFTLRLIFIVLFVWVLSLTTSPLDLCHGLEYLLSPLKKLKIPISEIILIIHLSLRFIPTLFEELDRIIKAHSARGVDFKKGNIITRIKRLVPVMVLLFKNSFHRADELALVLDLKGYHLSKNRTKLKRLKMDIKDYSFFILIGIILLIFLLWRDKNWLVILH